MKKKVPAHIRGEHCEYLVYCHFKRQGYQLKKRRWRHSIAEVDLVLYHPKVKRYLLVEVKSLSSWEWFPYRWSKTQKRKLFQVAETLAQVCSQEVLPVLAIVDRRNQVYVFDEWGPEEVL